MSYQIELRHLRYFQVLAEELNFRRAAARLFIAQPGLSRQIKQLEEMVNAQLLVRTKRSVKLTPAGEHLKREADRMLHQLSQAIKQTELIHLGAHGEVRVGFVGSAVHHLLPKLITAMHEIYPNIHTSLDELSNQVQLTMLLHDQLDLGFIRGVAIPAGLESNIVHEDTFSVVLPADHSMTASQFTNIGQLRAEKFILFSKEYSSEYYDKVVSICHDQGFEPIVSHKSVNAFTIFKLVEEGLGMAIVPSSLVGGYQMRIRAIEMTAIPQRTVLSAVWKRASANTSLTKVLELLLHQ